MATSMPLSRHPATYQSKMLEVKVPEQGVIPLVGHIITDEQIGSLQGVRMQPVNLSKIIKLLTDEHSLMLIDRHLHALKKMCKHYKDGYVMKDLVNIFKILNICADRVDEHPMYVPPIIDILKICSLPFLKERSSDETAYQQIAIESVAQLGYMMRVPSDAVRLQVCDTLIKFYSEVPPVQQVQRHQPNTQAYNQMIVEKSDVAETLVKSLTLLENDVNIKIAVLNVLQKLSKNSASNCDMMLRADGAQRLCSRLMDYDPSGQVLFRSVDILWNLLDHGSQEEVAAQLNNFACISQLRDAFIQQLTQGYSHYDRQLRNDLLVIASIIASVCLEAPLVETGFIKQLALFATFQEVKSHNALVKHLKLLTNHEDFELKKLIVNMLVICSRDPATIPILSEGKLLLALFSYVKANEKTAAPQEWTVAQFEEIQLLSMSALCTLGPLMIEDYMTCQGSTRALLLLEWCVGPAQNMIWYTDDYHGTGNSFHGAGGRDNKKAQMRQCLRLIRSMVSTGDESVLQDFTDQGALSQIIAILGKIIAHRKSKESVVDIEMQCDMLFILSAICENDVHRKELFGNQGVDVVVEFLRGDVSRLDSGLGHHRLLLAAVDCVWCAVVGCYITEDYFLEKEGVFLLLDLLENCPKNMHNLILGCLLDLCENPKTVAHVNAWRGKGDISAAHLLCDVWRDEEQMMGVAREPTCAMADVKKPLIGKLQESTGTIPLPADQPSLAIVDVSENMRAKVYALFCKMGFIELPGLTTEDHVTLTIIEHYLEFKLGEVWREVLEELEQEAVRPVTPDNEALEAIARTVHDRAEHVSQVQRELLEAQHQQSVIDEQEHYAEIRENHRQKEKAIKDFTDFVMRTSNYALLKAARERQEISVDASRVATNYKQSETFHTTELPNLAATIRTFASLQPSPFSFSPPKKVILRYNGGIISNPFLMTFPSHFGNYSIPLSRISNETVRSEDSSYMDALSASSVAFSDDPQVYSDVLDDSSVAFYTSREDTASSSFSQNSDDEDANEVQKRHISAEDLKDYCTAEKSSIELIYSSWSLKEDALTCFKHSQHDGCDCKVKECKQKSFDTYSFSEHLRFLKRMVDDGDLDFSDQLLFWEDDYNSSLHGIEWSDNCSRLYSSMLHRSSSLDNLIGQDGRKARRHTVADILIVDHSNSYDDFENDEEESEYNFDSPYKNKKRDINHNYSNNNNSKRANCNNVLYNTSSYSGHVNYLSNVKTPNGSLHPRKYNPAYQQYQPSERYDMIYNDTASQETRYNMNYNETSFKDEYRQIPRNYTISVRSANSPYKTGYESRGSQSNARHSFQPQSYPYSMANHQYPISRTNTSSHYDKQSCVPYNLSPRVQVDKGRVWKPGVEAANDGHQGWCGCGVCLNKELYDASSKSLWNYSHRSAKAPAFNGGITTRPYSESGGSDEDICLSDDNYETTEPVISDMQLEFPVAASSDKNNDSTCSSSSVSLDSATGSDATSQSSSTKSSCTSRSESVTSSKKHSIDGADSSSDVSKGTSSESDDLNDSSDDSETDSIDSLPFSKYSGSKDVDSSASSDRSSCVSSPCASSSSSSTETSTSASSSNSESRVEACLSLSEALKECKQLNVRINKVIERFETYQPPDGEESPRIDELSLVSSNGSNADTLHTAAENAFQLDKQHDVLSYVSVSEDFNYVNADSLQTSGESDAMLSSNQGVLSYTSTGQFTQTLNLEDACLNNLEKFSQSSSDLRTMTQVREKPRNQIEIIKTELKHDAAQLQADNQRSTLSENAFNISSNTADVKSPKVEKNKSDEVSHCVLLFNVEVPQADGIKDRAKLRVMVKGAEDTKAYEMMPDNTPMGDMCDLSTYKTDTVESIEMKDNGTYTSSLPNKGNDSVIENLAGVPNNAEIEEQRKKEMVGPELIKTEEEEAIIWKHDWNSPLNEDQIHFRDKSAKGKVKSFIQKQVTMDVNKRNASEPHLEYGGSFPNTTECSEPRSLQLHDAHVEARTKCEKVNSLLGLKEDNIATCSNVAVASILGNDISKNEEGKQPFISLFRSQMEPEVYRTHSLHVDFSAAPRHTAHLEVMRALDIPLQQHDIQSLTSSIACDCLKTWQNFDKHTAVFELNIDKFDYQPIKIERILPEEAPQSKKCVYVNHKASEYTIPQKHYNTELSAVLKLTPSIQCVRKPVTTINVCSMATRVLANKDLGNTIQRDPFPTAHLFTLNTTKPSLPQGDTVEHQSHIDFSLCTSVPEPEEFQSCDIPTSNTVADPSTNSIEVDTPTKYMEDHTPTQNMEDDTPTESMKGDTPTENMKGDTPTENMEGDTLTENTEADTSTENTEEYTPTEKVDVDTPPEIVDVDKPAGNIDTDIPIQNFYAKTLTENVDVDTPTENVDVDTPTENVDVDTSTENVDVDTPTENVDVDTPTENVDFDTPTENVDVDTSTENVEVDTLTENVDVDTPTKNVEDDTPAENVDVDRPPEIDDVNTPPVNGDFDTPTENINTETQTKNIETDTLIENVDIDTQTENIETDTLTENVDADTSTENLATDTPTDNIEVNTPTKDVHSDTPTENLVTVTPTDNIEVNTPTENVDVDTPTENDDVDTPTENVDVDTPTENVEADAQTENIKTNTSLENIESDTINMEASATTSPDKEKTIILRESHSESSSQNPARTQTLINESSDTHVASKDLTVTDQGQSQRFTSFDSISSMTFHDISSSSDVNCDNYNNNNNNNNKDSDEDGVSGKGNEKSTDSQISDDKLEEIVPSTSCREKCTSWLAKCPDVKDQQSLRELYQQTAMLSQSDKTDNDVAVSASSPCLQTLGSISYSPTSEDSDEIGSSDLSSPDYGCIKVHRLELPYLPGSKNKVTRCAAKQGGAVSSSSHSTKECDELNNRRSWPNISVDDKLDQPDDESPSSGNYRSVDGKPRLTWRKYKEMVKAKASAYRKLQALKIRSPRNRVTQPKQNGNQGLRKVSPKRRKEIKSEHEAGSRKLMSKGASEPIVDGRHDMIVVQSHLHASTFHIGNKRQPSNLSTKQTKTLSRLQNKLHDQPTNGLTSSQTKKNTLRFLKASKKKLNHVQQTTKSPTKQKGSISVQRFNEQKLETKGNKIKRQPAAASIADSDGNFLKKEGDTEHKLVRHSTTDMDKMNDVNKNILQHTKDTTLIDNSGKTLEKTRERRNNRDSVAFPVVITPTATASGPTVNSLLFEALTIDNTAELYSEPSDTELIDTPLNSEVPPPSGRGHSLPRVRGCFRIQPESVSE